MKYGDKIHANQNRIDLHEAYMQMAEIWAKRSKSNRKQVGALIVKDNRIISDGYNGMPAGAKEDVCEVWVDIESPQDLNCTHEELLDLMSTKQEVLHAESNAILKVAKSGVEGVHGADLYVTMSPCEHCAKLIIQSGIRNVFYREAYRESTGLDKLNEFNINTIKLG